MSEKSKDRGQGPRDRDERGEAAESAPAFEVEDDLALSALLDGELDEASAAKLRAKMVAQPELAERSAELGELSGHLRNLAHPSERSEAERQLESDRVDRMQAALRVRLDVEAAEVAEAEAVDSDAAEAAAPAPVIPLRRARDWWAPAAALAAGLLLYLAFDSGISGVETGGPGEPPGEFAQVPDLTPDPTLDPTLAPTLDPTPDPPPSPESALEWAAGPSPVSEVGAVPGGDARIEKASPGSIVASAADPPGTEGAAEWAEVDLAEVGEEELAIALEFDVLSDFDVIENLEILELLNGLDRVERI